MSNTQTHPKVISSIRKCFTQIPNAVVIDTSLSDGALRVFLYMSTKPDDWQFNNRDIQHKLNIKRAETIAKYWKELIQSGWISRQPVLNENGKPSGYFDYVLNFEPQIPTPQNAEVVLPTTDKQYTVNQQLRKNRSYTNKEISSNKEVTNTPLPPNGEKWCGSVWLQIAKNLDLVFDDSEKTTISRWAEYVTSIQKSITVLQIETNLHSLAKHKADGFDICSLITDTISAGYKWLLKPSAMYIKKSVVTKPAKAIKPHRFSNPEYIIPESPAEKTQLARYLQSCYQKRLNPKNSQPLTASEINTLDLHHKLFLSQDKDAKGCFVNYTSWTDYILQNEVHTGTPLIDQPLHQPNQLQPN